MPIGVLGAHVRWESVRELFKMLRAGGSIEIMLLARDGNVPIGPAEMEGKRLPLARHPRCGPRHQPRRRRDLGRW